MPTLTKNPDDRKWLTLNEKRRILTIYWDLEGRKKELPIGLLKISD